MKNNLDRIIKYSLLVSVGTYTVIAAFYFLGKPYGSGDESLFISDLNYINEMGWTAAIKKGISIPYMLLAYPIAKIISIGLALRLTNIILFAILLVYFRKVRSIKSMYFYAMVMFFYSSIGYFLVGTNDTLFIVAMTIFLSESHLLLNDKVSKRSFWWGLSAVVAIFTREMFILFVPILFLAVFLLLRHKKVHFQSLLPGLLLAVILTVVNLPSLKESGRLSYDSKLPPDHVSVSWPQRQYLAQLWVNEGKLKNYNHPSWNEVQSFVDDYGMDSLPRTVFEGISFDWKLTMKEFVKDGAYILVYSVRSMALTVLFVLVFGLRSTFRGRLSWRTSFIPIALLVMICVFAFVIISFIELRWLSSVFLASILYFHFAAMEGKIPKLWQHLNYATIVLLTVYGGYGLLTNLI